MMYLTERLITELSKPTLKSYVSKSTASYKNMNQHYKALADPYNVDQGEAQKISHKMFNRSQGTTRAKRKIDTPAGGKYPRHLEDLAGEARKHPKYEDFRNAFLNQTKHGTYWHVTSDPKFKIDPEKGPRDMSSMGETGPEKGKLMITSHLDNWASYYGKSRSHAARIDMSQVHPDHYRQVSRGFGNEFFVDHPEKAKVVGVYPISKAKRIDREIHNMLPSSDEELQKFHASVHQK